MTVSLQDLTNPGISLIHAALVGAHLPTINGAELNSPQFTPAANSEFVERLPELFVPRDGVHRLPARFPPVWDRDCELIRPRRFLRPFEIGSSWFA